MTATTPAVCDPKPLAGIHRATSIEMTTPPNINGSVCSATLKHELKKAAITDTARGRG